MTQKTMTVLDVNHLAGKAVASFQSACEDLEALSDFALSEDGVPSLSARAYANDIVEALEQAATAWRSKYTELARAHAAAKREHANRGKA